MPSPEELSAMRLYLAYSRAAASLARALAHLRMLPACPPSGCADPDLARLEHASRIEELTVLCVELAELADEHEVTVFGAEDGGANHPAKSHSRSLSDLVGSATAPRQVEPVRARPRVEAGSPIRWWARFRLSSAIEGGVRRVLLGSETEPFQWLVDLTDVCASNGVSAEVWWHDERDEGAPPAEKFSAGWVDEQGRVHFQGGGREGARRLACLLETNEGVTAECTASGWTLWSTRPRSPEESETHSEDRFCVGEVRIA